MIIATTFDHVANLCNDCVLFHNKETFIRDIVTFVQNNPNSIIAKRPGDFSLLILGTFDKTKKEPVILDNYEEIKLSDIVGDLNA